MKSENEEITVLSVWVITRGILSNHLRFSRRVEAIIVFFYWCDTILERAMQGDFEGAYDLLQAALLGVEAFDGPERVCHAHVDGEHVGLVCAPHYARLLVGALYEVMLEAGRAEDVSSGDFKISPAWGPISFSGQRLAEALMPEGPRTYEDMMLRWRIAAVAEGAFRRIPLRSAIAA